MYSIGEVSKKLGIPISTIRYYDSLGLIPSIKRSENGRKRVFENVDCEWLYSIECLKKADMSLKEIKMFLDLCIKGDSTIKERKNLIEQRRQKVIKQIDEMKDTLMMLEYKKWYYEVAETAGTCSVHDNIDQKDIPQKFSNYLKKLEGTTHKND